MGLTVLLLLAPGPMPAASPCPPREKGGSGCLLFPGWASNQTTSPCCSHRPGRLLHSQLPRTVDSSHTHLSLSGSPSSTGYGQRRQAGYWGLNSEVQSLSHCRHMMRQGGGIWTLGAETSSKVSPVLPMGEHGWSPAVPEEESSSRSCQTSFTPWVLKEVSFRGWVSASSLTHPTHTWLPLS